MNIHEAKTHSCFRQDINIFLSIFGRLKELNTVREKINFIL